MDKPKIIFRRPLTIDTDLPELHFETTNREGSTTN